MGSQKRESIGVRLSALALRARRVFFKMSMREKVLALLFAFALAFVWFSLQLDRHGAISQSHYSVGLLEQDQQLELGEGVRVREDYQARISAIDVTALPNIEDVRAQVDALVRRAGFATFDLGEARTTEGAGLKFHTFQLDVDKVSYFGVKSFTETIKTELPHLSLESIVIAALPRNEDFVDARYVFKSIEYTK